MRRIGLVWRTVRHLTARQLVYQVLNRLRGQARLWFSDVATVSYFLVVPDADKPISWVADTFTFLNRSVPMAIVDWNYTGQGKLWTYNLNYFDFLNQPGLMPDEGLRLIRKFISQTDSLNDGLEPYPTSLRIINWVQFLSRNQIQDDTINRHLYAQTDLLRRRLEYHLAGNHLLENGFALLTAALYFHHNVWFRRAAQLVRTELSAQILTDGGHDERSPMYHQILLDRLLDVLLALRHDTWHNAPMLIDFLENKATKMQGWLDAITFRNGDVPMMNDAAWNVAPTTDQIWAKAVRVGLNAWSVKTQTTYPGSVSSQTSRPDGFWQSCPGSVSSQTPDKTADTGYRKFTFPRYELFADAGQIEPDHQPGHAHADTFSFVLYVDNQPLIVDSGMSTYETGTRRTWERSTAAHNTVDVMGLSSSEVWAGFRVGRRARVTVLTDTETRLTARHDGYQHLGIVHERAWSVGPNGIQLIDRLTGTKQVRNRNQPGVARLHFHPDVAVSVSKTGINAGAVRITFASVLTTDVRLTTYEMAEGFNRLRTALCVEITFTNYLETILLPT